MKKIVSIAVVLVMLFSLFAGTQAVVASESTGAAASVYYDKPISDPMKDVTITGSTIKEGSFSSKLGFAFTNNALYTFNRDKDKNEVSFTRSSTEYSSGNKYAQAKFTFSDTYVSNNGVDHGKFILKTNLTVSTPCRINFGVYNKGGTSFTSSDLIDEKGKFLDGTECQSGVTYEIEAIYDWDEKNVTYKVNGKEVQSKSFSAKSQLNSIRVNCYAHNAAEGAKITFADLQLFHAIKENVGEISISSSGEGVEATVVLTKASTGSILPDRCVIIVASYSANNELKACISEEKSLQEGNNTLKLTLSDLNGGTVYKAFVWNNFENLTPLK